MLKKLLGPKKTKVTGECRKLRNEELQDLYSSPSTVRVIKSRRMTWAGHVVCIWERRGVYRVLVGKPERKRTLGRPRRRWEDNIKKDRQEMVLAQDRDRWQALVIAVMNLRFPYTRVIPKSTSDWLVKINALS